jgi:hypothetical protein
VKVTPRHDKFIGAIADSQIHVIATMRGKDQYEMEKSDNKTTVKKLGVGAKQREGFEYEFTATFLIDQKTNLATPQKDNTHIFEHEGDEILTEKHGIKIIQWANSGEGFTPSLRNITVPSAEDEFKLLKNKVIAKCTELGGSANEGLMTILKEIEPSGNPNKIKTIEVMQKLADAIGIKKEEE